MRVSALVREARRAGLEYQPRRGKDGVGGVRAWDGLSQDAQQALRTVGFLELTVTSRSGIGAIVNAPSTQHLYSVLQELVDSGWLRQDGGIGRDWHRERLSVAVECRQQLVALAAGTAAPQVADAVARYADELLRYLEHTAAYGSPRVVEVIAVVRGAGRSQAPLLGARVADTAWASILPDHDNPEQWLPLCEAGERCATDARDPRLLISLLRRSGEYFAAVDRRHLTEGQWVRALALARSAGDVATADEVSRSLAELYRDWGRLHKALDVLQNLVHSRQENGGQPHDVAEALAELGATLLQANRPADAVDTLTLANNLLRGGAGDVSCSGTESDLEAMALRGTVLITLGRALEARAEPARAARYYSRALALLIDVDEGAAEDVRGRLAGAADAAVARRQADVSSLPSSFIGGPRDSDRR